MTQELLAAEAAPDLWRDNIWDRLLDSLDERSVSSRSWGRICFKWKLRGTRPSLDHYLARRLALINKLSADNLPADRALNHVVCQLTRLRKDRYDICDDIFQIMKAGGLPAVQASASTGRDHRFQPVRLHDVRLAAGEGDQRGAVRQLAGNACPSPTRPRTWTTCRPARRSSPSPLSIT